MPRAHRHGCSWQMSKIWAGQFGHQSPEVGDHPWGPEGHLSLTPCLPQATRTLDSQNTCPTENPLTRVVGKCGEDKSWIHGGPSTAYFILFPLRIISELSPITSNARGLARPFEANTCAYHQSHWYHQGIQHHSQNLKETDLT